MYFQFSFLFYGIIAEVLLEPCNNYRTLQGPTEERRSPLKVLIETETAISDDRLDTTVWYRVNISAGKDLTRKCPGIFRCGTLNPIWLNGTLPEENEGEANRTVCLSNGLGCCSYQYHVTIKNCGQYRVYYFYNVPSVPSQSAYCFGDIPDETTTAVLQTITHVYNESAISSTFQTTTDSQQQLSTGTFKTTEDKRKTTTEEFYTFIASETTATTTMVTHRYQNSTVLTSISEESNLNSITLDSTKTTKITTIINETQEPVTTQDHSSNNNNTLNAISFTPSIENWTVNSLPTETPVAWIYNITASIMSSTITTRSRIQNMESSHVSIETDTVLIISVSVAVTVTVICIAGKITLRCLYHRRLRSKKASNTFENINAHVPMETYEEIRDQENDFIDDKDFKHYGVTSADNLSTFNIKNDNLGDRKNVTKEFQNSCPSSYTIGNDGYHEIENTTYDLIKEIPKVSTVETAPLSSKPTTNDTAETRKKTDMYTLLTPPTENTETDSYMMLTSPPVHQSPPMRCRNEEEIQAAKAGKVFQSSIEFESDTNLYENSTSIDSKTKPRVSNKALDKLATEEVYMQMTNYKGLQNSNDSVNKSDADIDTYTMMFQVKK